MKACFIGAGNMASALIGGLVAGGARPADLCAVDIDAGQRDRLAARHGVATHESPEAALAGADCVVLAVKPQQLPAVAASLAPWIGGRLVVTIAAGVRIGDLSRWLGGHRRIVRAMPNTPALIRQGISGLYAAAEVGGEDRELATRILGAVGEVLWVEHESMIDAVTAVSGSGPAYVFLCIEALEEAAIASGFPAGQARALAVSTFAGAGALAAAESEPPAVLRARVTSRGGTTERGVAALEAGGLRVAMREAVAAALRRAVELGDESGRAA
jgi:pyrroline-5-carboxylate reductase